MVTSHRSLGRGAYAALVAVLLGGSAHALPADGLLLVAEAAAGSVLDAAAGGDLGSAARFATGLATPMGLCIGPGGALLVAERSAGTVKVITAGGDMTAVAPFATGLSSPVGLACEADRIWVVEHDGGAPTGRVLDITSGGDFSSAAGHATGLTGAVGLGWDAQQRLLVSTRSGELFDVTLGGEPASATPLCTLAGWALGAVGPALVTSPDFGAIWLHDVGGELSNVAPFAELGAAAGLLETPYGIFAVADSAGELFEITSGGDFAGVVPYAIGLGTDPAEGFVGMVLYRLCGNGRLDPGEQCDDAGESAECNADCTLAFCGDGIVNETAGEACDDAGESAECNADCSIAFCGDGVLNVTAGEQCDEVTTSYSCDGDCTLPECGDGFRNAVVGEECDDAGESARCNADCKLAYCGDGVLNVTAGEECDDGNLIDGDGCSSQCRLEAPHGTGGESPAEGGGAPVDPNAPLQPGGGCGCRAGAATSLPSAWGLAALAFVVAAGARRRLRRSRAGHTAA